MLVFGARNQQHYYPWATAARTVPTPHQSHDAELPAALGALLHFASRGRTSTN